MKGDKIEIKDGWYTINTTKWMEDRSIPVPTFTDRDYKIVMKALKEGDVE